jgi:hypothetical protein
MANKIRREEPQKSYVSAVSASVVSNRELHEYKSMPLLLHQSACPYRERAIGTLWKIVYWVRRGLTLITGRYTIISNFSSYSYCSFRCYLCCRRRFCCCCLCYCNCCSCWMFPNRSDSPKCPWHWEPNYWYLQSQKCIPAFIHFIVCRVLAFCQPSAKQSNHSVKRIISED